MKTEQFKKRETGWAATRRRAGWLAGFALVLALAWVLGWSVSHRHHGTAAMPSSTHSSSPFALKEIHPLVVHAELPRKVVYPYSLIPGGVHSLDDLKAAIEKDRVVSAQYAAFRLEYARIMLLDRDIKMHVAYRRGDDVYWTQRELRLAKGEMLITDGTRTALARCGNFIDTAIDEPASANEPTEQELFTPIQNQYTGELESDNRFPELQPIADPYGPPTVTNYHPIGGTSPAIVLPSGPGGPFPYPGGSQPPHSGPTPPHGGNPPWEPLPPRIEYPQPPGGPTPPPPPVKTPEPGTGILLLAGLLALFLFHEWKTRRSPKNLN